MSEDDHDTPELRVFRLAARAWLAGAMKPLVRSANGAFRGQDDSEPYEFRLARARNMQRSLYDAGYAGLTYPKEYGGGGVQLEYERAFFQEAKAFEMPTAFFAVSLNILGKTLLAYGTEEQKREHLPNMLRGDEIWIQLLSEPSGGSDLAGLTTRALRDGDSYLLNGQKCWSTGAQFADYALCPARTDWDAPKHKGISMFIVGLRQPGVEVRSIKQMNGEADFCEEFLTDVAVPARNLVGRENEGWSITRGLLEIEHEWVGRSGGGYAPPTDVDDLIAAVHRRGLVGDAGVRRAVADIYVIQAVHRALAVRVNRGMAAGVFNSGYGSLLKLGNDLVRQRRAEVALDLAGSSGVAWRPGAGESDCVPIYLRSRSATIAGGTSEIQRNNISERALGLPREPAFDRDVPFNQVEKN